MDGAPFQKSFVIINTTRTIGPIRGGQVHRISVLTACHAERRVGDRFSLADGTSGRRLESVPFPEHEPAPSALGRNLPQLPPLGMKTFPKVFQVALDFFFRPMDGGGDLLCRVRPLLQEGADLTPCGFRFLQLSDYGSGIHPPIIARLLSRRISCGEGNPLPVRIPLDCKGDPASTSFPQDPLFTPEKAVVCTGFAVRSFANEFPSRRWRSFRGVGRRHIQIIESLCYPLWLSVPGVAFPERFSTATPTPAPRACPRHGA